MSETEALTGGSWRELLGPKNLGASTVLAGGVVLYATNEFHTISLMPSAIAEIGGQRYYAWVTPVCLVASVAAATTVSAALARVGAKSAYLGGTERVRRGERAVRRRADDEAAVGGPDGWLCVGFVMLAVVGVLASWRTGRSPRPAEIPTPR